MRCGECGMAITAEVREKHQKNGNTHRYTYYRCTKKSAVGCSQSYVREEVLACKALTGIDVLLTHEAPRPFYPQGKRLDAGKTVLSDVLASMRLFAKEVIPRFA